MACSWSQSRAGREGTRTSAAKHQLVDVPVSNHGARVRFVIYKKGLQDTIEIVGPTSLGGGLKSPEYLALNPQGKMPLLLLPGGGGSLPESEVIVSYLLDKFEGQGPSLRAATPEQRAVGTLAARILDMYVSPVQAAMYRDGGLSAEQRAEQIGIIAQQLDALELAIKDTAAPFVCGSEITAADGALFPTFVFFNFALTKFFGWRDVFANRPKLGAWWAAVQQDPEASKVIAEIDGGLQAWEASGRWRDQGIIAQVESNPQLKWAH